MERKYYKTRPERKPEPVKKESIKNESVTEAKEGIRLNKYIANSGICARRKADEHIKDGVVTVNDQVVTEMGYRVMPGDVVKFKDKKVTSVKFVYILLNKPKDYITTTSDDEGRKTVMELLKNATKERIYPVGRLDRNTTGLLIFTNDGEMANELAHPSRMVTKLYEVTVNNPVHIQDLEAIAKGVELEEGIALVDEIAYAHATDKRVVGIKLHVGWNRVVRRIFEKLGYDVIKLDRVMYGPLTKKDLPRGKWRMLREPEVVMLKHLGKK